jgi:hypothetical protein
VTARADGYAIIIRCAGAIHGQETARCLDPFGLELLGTVVVAAGTNRSERCAEREQNEYVTFPSPHPSSAW